MRRNLQLDGNRVALGLDHDCIGLEAHCLAARTEPHGSSGRKMSHRDACRSQLRQPHAFIANLARRVRASSIQIHALILTLALSLRVTPMISFAPATLELRVHFDPTETDRQVRVILESGDFYRSSTWDIEPGQRKRLEVWTLRDVPAGDYQAVAMIGRADDERDRFLARAVERINVEIHAP